MERGDRPQGVQVGTCGFRSCPLLVDRYWNKLGLFGKPPLVLNHATGKMHYHNWQDGHILTDEDYERIAFKKNMDESEKLWHPNMVRLYGDTWGCNFCNKHGVRFYMHNHQCSHNRNTNNDPYWQARKASEGINMEAKPLDRGQKTLF